MKLLSTLILVLMAAKGVAAQTGTPPKATMPIPTVAAAVEGNNAFALDLYGRLRKQPGNLFFSPESISTAFAMTYAGARGETATQMASVFHFTLPASEIHPAMGSLLGAMNEKNPNYQLSVANALWAQQGRNLQQDYLKLVEANYAAGFHQVDFEKSPEAARNTINKWIENQTNDKIQDMLAPGVVNSTTRLVLTNAIYFKGDWLDAFDKSDTSYADFHPSSTQAVNAPLMHITSNFNYFDGGTFQALELPYKGNALTMVVLLPKNVDGLPALEKSLTPDALTKWIGKLGPEPKELVTLPRFTMTQQFELGDTLSAMGMPDAFSGAANFSGMTGKRDFFISAAIHKAFVDVNETGTEAAAATSIEMRATAMRYEPPSIVFKADHPFLFLIRDTRSGSILFLGRVVDPTK
jgi:serpin B